MSEVSVLVCPFVPDAYAVFLQVFDVGVALQEPEQFVDDGFQVQLFGGQQGEAFFEVEPHLVSENADCSCSCTVFFSHSFVQDAFQ